MIRHLLIDGDVLAYKASAVIEKAIEWEPGFWTWHCDEDLVKDRILAEVDAYLTHLDAYSFTLCLTDPHNFRKDILPTYKGNRANIKKPLVLKSIREWLIEEHGAYMRPGLEGDDILGILATWPNFQKGMEKIIVSIDKDMKTVPCLYCRDLKSEVVEITLQEADRWHMIQTLAGDSTDGYDGCPGIGIQRAEEAIESMTSLKPYEHEILRGKRKGEIETRYKEVPTDNLWDVVVSRFVAAGLNEAVALTQARVARILRYGEYDMKKKEPILWNTARI